MIDHQAALIYTMVLVSAADRNMSDAELRIIGDNVRDLPAFAGYDHGKLTETLAECAALLDSENGLQEILTKSKAALPNRLRETAYALSFHAAAAASESILEEVRVINRIRVISRLNYI